MGAAEFLHAKQNAQYYRRILKLYANAHDANAIFLPPATISPARHEKSTVTFSESVNILGVSYQPQPLMQRYFDIAIC